MPIIENQKTQLTMKRICTLLMAVVFLSFTAVSAQDATTKSKNEVKKEVGQKLKKDGTVDKRYKQADAKVKEVKALPENAKTKSENAGQKLKKDGTVDKRYKQGEAVAKEVKAAPAKVAKEVSATGDHLKKDGSADMRYKENREGLHKGTTHIKKDGTPDKRYKENK